LPLFYFPALQNVKQLFEFDKRKFLKKDELPQVIAISLLLALHSFLHHLLELFFRHRCKRRTASRADWRHSLNVLHQRKFTKSLSVTQTNKMQIHVDVWSTLLNERLFVSFDVVV
jgi:hypothetical protein